MKTSPERRRGKESSNPAKAGLTLHMREKLAVTAMVIMLALFALIFRLWKIQNDNSEAFNQKVLSQQRYDSGSLADQFRSGGLS